MTQDDIIRMAKESGAYFQTFYQIIEFALSIIAVNNINLFKKK